MDLKFYAHINDEKVGPVDAATLKTLGVTRETLVWYKGLAEWTPAADAYEAAVVLGFAEPKPEAEEKPAAVETAEVIEPDYLPRTQIALSVIVTLLMGSPFSIMAIVFNCIAKARYQNGEYESGAHSCLVARKWLSVAITVGVIVNLFAYFFYIKPMLERGLL